MGSRHEPNILKHRAAMRTFAYLRNKYAPAAGGMPRSGEAAVTSAEPTFPKIRSARWSGQRDIRVFASQIRTGFRRLPAPSPARYKRFAFALRSHPGGFESRRFIEKSTAPERCRAFTFSGAGNGTRTRECQLGKLMPYHLAMPAYVGDSITRLSCSIQGWRCLF